MAQELDLEAFQADVLRELENLQPYRTTITGHVQGYAVGDLHDVTIVFGDPNRIEDAPPEQGKPAEEKAKSGHVHYEQTEVVEISASAPAVRKDREAVEQVAEQVVRQRSIM